MRWRPTSSPAFQLGAPEVLQVVFDQPTGLTEPLRVEVESVALE